MTRRKPWNVCVNYLMETLGTASRGGTGKEVAFNLLLYLS